MVQAESSLVTAIQMTNISNQERESILFRLEQLEHHQQFLAKYMAQVKRHFERLNEQFQAQPELQQLNSLQEITGEAYDAVRENHDDLIKLKR